MMEVYYDCFGICIGWRADRCCDFLTVIVLAQSGKDKSLSGTIAGGASSDTYFGKNKGQSREKLLARLTMVAAIVFAVLVVVLYVLIARQ
jgi:preprotein translocase subunit SecG